MRFLILVMLFIPFAHGQTSSEEGAVALRKISAEADQLNKLMVSLTALEPQREALMTLLQETHPDSPLLPVLRDMEKGTAVENTAPKAPPILILAAVFDPTDPTQKTRVVFTLGGKHYQGTIGAVLVMGGKSYRVADVLRLDPDALGRPFFQVKLEGPKGITVDYYFPEKAQ